MGTAAQNTANLANAQFSTGPRTTEGKARVGQNALRHGLTAKHLVIREDEREEFAALLNQILATDRTSHAFGRSRTSRMVRLPPDVALALE